MYMYRIHGTLFNTPPYAEEGLPPRIGTKGVEDILRRSLVKRSVDAIESVLVERL